MPARGCGLFRAESRTLDPVLHRPLGRAVSGRTPSQHRHAEPRRGYAATTVPVPLLLTRPAIALGAAYEDDSRQSEAARCLRSMRSGTVLGSVS